MMRGLVFLSALAMLLGGCGSKPPPSTPDQLDDLTVTPLTDVVESLRDVTASMNVVSHISRSGIDDSASHVTTSVLVPKGPAPAGGFPIVALGNAVAGLTADCAPSLSPNLLGTASTIERLLEAGYVVSVPDFQGLGKPTVAADSDVAADANGYHAYLDSTTVGYNMIDAVDATHRAETQTSESWLALGVGAGGQAAWAANELVDNYGYGLNMVGSVSISPALDLSGLADAAVDGTLTDDQKVMLVRFLTALHNEYGDNIDLDDFRRGAAGAQWDALLGCPAAPSARELAARIPAADLKPADADAVATLRGYLQKVNLPQGPAQNPLLVVYSGDDPAIPAGWTGRALDQACRMGDTVTIRQHPDPRPDSAEVLAWIGDRFASRPATNDCEGRVS